MRDPDPESCNDDLKWNLQESLVNEGIWTQIQVIGHDLQFAIFSGKRRLDNGFRI